MDWEYNVVGGEGGGEGVVAWGKEGLLRSGIGGPTLFPMDPTPPEQDKHKAGQKPML